MSEKSEGAIDKEQSRNISIMISLMDFLYLPDLILKLFVFIRAISLTTTAKLVSVSVRATEKIKNLNIFFL